MATHRLYGQADEADIPIGDVGFVGVDARNAPERIAAGFCAAAVNKDFSRGYAETRQGWVTPTWAGVPGIAFDGNYDGTEEGIDFPTSFKPAGLGTIYGASVFSDPNGRESLLVAVRNGVWRLAESAEPELIRLPEKVQITGPVRLIQAFDRVILFRGEELTPLEWNPTLDFTTGRADFVEIADPATTNGSYDARIPNASDACAFANRLWIPVGRDQVAVSYVLDYTLWDPDMARLRVNAGTDDETVRVYPATSQQLMVFKRRSVYGLTGIWGDDLAFSVTIDLASDSRGLVGRDAITQLGSRLVWVSDGAIWTATLNDSNKFVFDDQALSAPIEGLMRRIHWQYGAGICMTAHEERLLVAVPLDGARENNAILVFNLTTKNWEGYWTANYLRVKALLQVSENGRKRLAIVNGTGGEVTLVWVPEADEDTLKQLAGVGNTTTAKGLADGAVLVTGEGKSDFVHGYSSWIEDDLTTRGYTLDGLQAERGIRLSVDHETWNPKFDVTLRRGAAESETSVASSVVRGFKRVALARTAELIGKQWDSFTFPWTPLGYVDSRWCSTFPVYPFGSATPGTWNWKVVYDLQVSGSGETFFGPMTTLHFGWLNLIGGLPYYVWPADPEARPAENVYVRIRVGFHPEPWTKGDVPPLVAVWPTPYPSAAATAWRVSVYAAANPENGITRTYTAAQTAKIMDGSYGGSEYSYELVTAPSTLGDLWVGYLTFDLPLGVARYMTAENAIVVKTEGLTPVGLSIVPWHIEGYYYKQNFGALECVRTQKVFRRPLVNWTEGTAPGDVQPAGLDDYAWAIDAGIGTGLTFGKTQRQVENWRTEKRGDLIQVRMRNWKGYSAVHGTRIDAQMGRRAAGSRLA
jgi:hypothetical protein